MSYSENIHYFKINTGAQSREQVLALIAQIDAIVDALLNQALTSVTGGNIVEYEIDTGQSKNRVRYSDTGQIINAVNEYKTLRVYYENKITPRQVRAIPSKNMNTRRW